MTRNFTRILVPTDFNASSNAALTLAKRMAAMSGASLHLLHVLDEASSGAAVVVGACTPSAETRDARLEGALTRLVTQLTPAEHASFRGTANVAFGNPAQVIVEHATAHDIDLIVMGTHGRDGVALSPIGSVAERVVRSAACPVLTVRDHGAVRTGTAETASVVA